MWIPDRPDLEGGGGAVMIFVADSARCFEIRRAVASACAHGRPIFLIALFIAEFSIMPSEMGFHRERADTSAVIVIKETPRERPKLG
jgi:hypothetical protein